MSSVIDVVGSVPPMASSAERRVSELEPQQNAARQPSRLGMMASKKKRCSSGIAFRIARFVCSGSWL